ncbi:hypothetical protein IU436_25405 [Nocardia farcinica]|uniref:hypothetical protein n=1 Tax=Nocardia farcinica TaxID=37329 RepID=UPI001895C2F0|nr:hypothetical protein [Nocardia farcinica]MBF6422030.1 hypothetical protein [Nocardia farcinica]MBF6433687.1 hypothetical protein [Nocardia farcinica]MBF6504695.1 hypothetical protein [Nocardia farcinica]
MGAAAPRKTAPRKAPVRKAPTPKVETDLQERRRRQVELFEQLRTRAAGMAVAEAPAGKTYTLGPAEGFDPPVVATYPTDLAAQVELDLASRSGDTVEFLRIVFGEYGFLRIVQAFNGQPDGLRLLAGLQLRLTDHFLGRGASEAGGTAASSTS